jgi:hypothetical protein
MEEEVNGRGNTKIVFAYFDWSIVGGEDQGKGTTVPEMC